MLAAAAFAAVPPLHRINRNSRNNYTYPDSELRGLRWSYAGSAAQRAGSGSGGRGERLAEYLPMDLRYRVLRRIEDRRHRQLDLDLLMGSDEPAPRLHS